MSSSHLPPPPFDYITAEDYRALLESDYQEMQLCLDSGSWKASVVLAGSLIEAVLVESLEWLGSVPGQKDPREMHFAEAITVCKERGQISETAAKLCSAVKDYRNLIHPGRVVRTSAAPPDAASALISTALVGKIADEIASVRRKVSGYTAEQVLKKIESDSGVVPILPHLIRGMRVTEVERLILKLIPAAHESHLYQVDEFTGPDQALLNRYSTTYRVVLHEADENCKRKASLAFYDLLLKGSAFEIATYGAAFFRASDLGYLPDANRRLVIDHLLGNVMLRNAAEDYRQATGIAEYLVPDDMSSWLNPIIRKLVAAQQCDELRSYFLREFPKLCPMAIEKAEKLLESTARNVERRGNKVQADQLRDLASLLTIPF